MTTEEAMYKLEDIMPKFVAASKQNCVAWCFGSTASTREMLDATEESQHQFDRIHALKDKLAIYETSIAFNELLYTIW